MSKTFAETVKALPSRCDWIDPFKESHSIPLYHCWQALLDWQAGNFRTIGEALRARQETALIQADLEGLDLNEVKCAFDKLARYIRQDSGIDFGNNSR